MLPLKKIISPIDFSGPSLVALDTACELAGHFSGEVCLLHVVPFSPPFPADLVGVSIGVPETDDERMNNALAQLREIAAARVPDGVQARCEVRMGYADKEITSAAYDEGADLIVISTHGLTGWRHLVFGSVAESIVRAAQTPVLTIHAPAAASEESSETSVAAAER